METKVNPWKANLSNGLILGLTGVIISLILWFLDLTFNRGTAFISIIVAIFLLFYFIKQYRENYLHGYMTYGQSFGTGMILWFYSAIISTIFIYLLYSVIDPELPAKSLAMAEEKMRASGRVPEEMMEQSMAMQKKFMTPTIITIFGFAGSMFWGVIVTLIVSIFTRKEGNPLLETTENKEV